MKKYLIIISAIALMSCASANQVRQPPAEHPVSEVALDAVLDIGWFLGLLEMGWF